MRPSCFNKSTTGSRSVVQASITKGSVGSSIHWMVRNAPGNAKIKQFVQRIGHVESPAVAAFYVARVNETFVIKKAHDIGVLLANAEGYRTQWATGAAITGTRAKQIDQTQSNCDTAGEAMELLRARRTAQQGA